MTEVNPASHEAYRLIAEDAIADDEYIRIGANALGICASGAADGIGTPPIAAPWPAVLEHAPTAELVAALKGRAEVQFEEIAEGQIWEWANGDEWGAGPATMLLIHPESEP